jgi:2-amino-4-hydroxy-6-hydroxymethyldihydropteridine diphosphokinase
MSMREAYLSLGSNLGDREGNLRAALEHLAQERVWVAACSSVYETEPQELPGQPWFFNLVVLTRAEFFPIQLLKITQRIERQLGREAPGGRISKGPRLIDIDLLLFGKVVMETPVLTLPHPRMENRRFVLEPLIEIAPNLADPSSGTRFAALVRTLHGQQMRLVRGPFTLE